MGNFVPNTTPKIPDLQAKILLSRYVFCKTSDADAGKELRIELRTNTKQYSGVVNTVYCGDKIDIWEFFSHNTVWKQSLHFSCCLQV